MQVTLLSGYPDNIGRRHAWVGHGHGPAQYNRTTHDVLAFPVFKFYVDLIAGPAITKSGNYIVYPIAKGVGARVEWALKWMHFGGEEGGEVEHGHNLANEEVQIGGFGGQF